MIVIAAAPRDPGKRGKDIAILQMGQDANRKISEIRNRVTCLTIKLFLHTQVWWRHEAKLTDPPLDPS
jgi:hypothetical protein